MNRETGTRLQRLHRADSIDWCVCVGVVCAYLVFAAYNCAAANKRRVQSPKASTQQSEAGSPLAIAAVQPLASDIINPVSSSITASAVVAPSNRTVRVSLAWDASPDHNTISNYAVHYGIASRTYTNAVSTRRALSLTISNLNARTRYYFAANATFSNGVTGNLSPEIFWPQPITNYVGLSVWHRTNLTDPGRIIWQTVMMNPPGDTSFYETKIWQTNDNVTVLRINSSTLLVANTNQP